MRLASATPESSLPQAADTRTHTHTAATIRTKRRDLSILGEADPGLERAPLAGAVAVASARPPSGWFPQPYLLGVSLRRSLAIDPYPHDSSFSEHKVLFMDCLRANNNQSR